MVDKHLVVIINRETNHKTAIVVVFSYTHILRLPWWNLACIGRQSYQSVYTCSIWTARTAAIDSVKFQTLTEICQTNK